MDRLVKVVVLIAGLALGTGRASSATQPAGPVNFAPPLELAPAPTLTHVNPSQSGENTKYGLLGLLDHRSVIGTGFYPEPFLVDEGDVDREIELDWAHKEGHHAVSDDVTAEVEWSFGQLTFELECPYLRDYSDTIDPGTGLKSAEREEGIGPPSIAARYPAWEWVSADGNVENAVMAACEVAFPSNSVVGKTTEIVPEVFDLLRVGDHFGLQTHFGYSTLYGGDENNHQTFEYSADFSYNIGSDQIPLPPHVIGLVPMVELGGERPLNYGGQNDDLTGVIGGRNNLDAIGPAAPRLGVGYIFPIDKGSREEFNWGVVVSLVFDL
jgi:hypothetical protein